LAGVDEEHEIPEEANIKAVAMQMDGEKMSVIN